MEKEFKITADLALPCFHSNLRLKKVVELGKASLDDDELESARQVCEKLNEKAGEVLNGPPPFPVTPDCFLVLKFFFGLTVEESAMFFWKYLTPATKN